LATRYGYGRCDALLPLRNPTPNRRRRGISERTVFEYPGGRAFEVVSAVLEEMRQDGRRITEEDEARLLEL